MAAGRRIKRRVGIDAALVLGAASLAWVGQRLLRDRPGSPEDGSVAYLLAVLSLLAAAVRLEGLVTAPLVVPAPSRHLRLSGNVRRRIGLAGASVGLTLVLLWMLPRKTP